VLFLKVSRTGRTSCGLLENRKGRREKTWGAQIRESDYITCTSGLWACIEFCREIVRMVYREPYIAQTLGTLEQGRGKENKGNT